jgi:hypothetical protein
VNYAEIRTWFLHDSWFSMPRYVWALLTGLAIVENVLGHSKNPRLRSVAAVAAQALTWLIEKSRVSAIPVAGPMIVTVLRAITGDKNGNGIPDDQETPIPPPGAGPPPVAAPPAA